MSITCRRCLPAELKMGPVERKLHHVAWAVRQFRRYTAFAKKVQVVLPEPEAVLVAQHKEHHQRLADLLVELSMYPLEWVAGEDDWNLHDAFLDPKALVDATTEKGETLKAPQWEHPGDYEVVQPADKSGEELDVQSLSCCVATFDGGAAQKLGVGGYCIQDAAGRIVSCQGKWYGKQHDTNNEAECQALLDLLGELAQGGALRGAGEVMVLGDSRLVLDFATRKARPGKATLFLKVRELQALVKHLRWKQHCVVKFRHVGRALNGLADWVGNVARELQADVDCTHLCEGRQLWDPLPCSCKDAAQQAGGNQVGMLRHQDR